MQIVRQSQEFDIYQESNKIQEIPVKLEASRGGTCYSADPYEMGFIDGGWGQHVVAGPHTP